MQFFCVFALSLACHADPSRQMLYGSWGTAAQCARASLLPGASKRAAPFEISADWLRHGDMWCQLIWFPLPEADPQTFFAARAMCGEDSVQSYGLGLHLTDGSLTLIWDEALINGPLSRCTPPG